VISASISGTIDPPNIPYNGVYQLSATATSTTNVTTTATIADVVVDVAPNPTQGKFEVDITNGVVKVYTNVNGCTYPQQHITDTIQRSIDGGPYETIASVPWDEEYDDLSAPTRATLLYRLVASRPNASAIGHIESAPSMSVGPILSPSVRLACTGPPDPYSNQVAPTHLIDPSVPTSTTRLATPTISATTIHFSTTSSSASKVTSAADHGSAPVLTIPALLGIAASILAACLGYVFWPRKDAR
jgi:hypothetical protein